MSLVQDIRSASRGVVSEPVRALRESVLGHLRDLFATPSGSVLMAHTYGLDDPTQLFHEYPASAQHMMRQLREVIARFEPRLVHVKVTHDIGRDLNLVLRFEIEGVLVHDGRAMPVRFAAAIDSNSRVELK